MLAERKKANDARKLAQKCADQDGQQKPKPGPYVFANKEGERYLGTSINHLHRNVCGPKGGGNEARSCRRILCSTLYAIQCLQDSENRVWMHSLSCGSQGIAALSFRSDTFIRHPKQ